MRGAEYIPVASIPIVDLGAQYEAAKLRREESEERKLAYLNQFKQVRGSLSDGVRPAVQQRWNQVESLLDQGDMSFEGRKKLQQAYKDYAEYTAQGVDFTRALDEREAEVLSNPQKYNLDVLKELDTYRSVKPDDTFLSNPTLPSLAQYTRYQPKRLSSSTMASTIYNNMKQFDGLDAIRNADGTLNQVALENAVNAQYIGQSSEDVDAIIAEELSRLGRLDGNVAEAVEVTRSLSDAEKQNLIKSASQRTIQTLSNLVSKDAFTREEQSAADLKEYEAKTRIQGRQSEREIGLRQAGDAALQRERIEAEQQETAPKVNPYALFSDYVNETITDNILSADEDEMVKNLAPSLPPGYEVEATSPWYSKDDIITIRGQKGAEGVEISLPKDLKTNPKSRALVKKQIQRAILDGIPAGTENPEEDKLLYLSRIINQGALSSAPADAQTDLRAKYNY
jgi:hypothetical protein